MKGYDQHKRDTTRRDGLTRGVTAVTHLSMASVGDVSFDS